MEVSGQLHVMAVFSPRIKAEGNHWMMVGGPQSRSGRGGVEQKSQPLPGIEPWSSSP
jgi:hypothetical protein